MRRCHDPLVRADAIAALDGAVAEAERILAMPAGPGGGDRTNGSLCHGIGGLVELLTEAWLVQRDDTLLALARRLAAFIHNDAGPARRRRSGIPGGGAATPGLMLGSAGIGWAMYRASSQAEVASGWMPRISVPSTSRFAALPADTVQTGVP